MIANPPTDPGGSSAGGRVAGLVLAAGAGRRFGRPKALVELDGERLVDRAVRVLETGGLRNRRHYRSPRSRYR